MARKHCVIALVLEDVHDKNIMFNHNASFIMSIAHCDRQRVSSLMNRFMLGPLRAQVLLPADFVLRSRERCQVTRDRTISSKLSVDPLWRNVLMQVHFTFQAPEEEVVFLNTPVRWRSLKVGCFAE